MPRDEELQSIRAANEVLNRATKIYCALIDEWTMAKGSRKAELAEKIRIARHDWQMAFLYYKQEREAYHNRK